GDDRWAFPEVSEDAQAGDWTPDARCHGGCHAADGRSPRRRVDRYPGLRGLLRRSIPGGGLRAAPRRVRTPAVLLSVPVRTPGVLSAPGVLWGACLLPPVLPSRLVRVPLTPGGRHSRTAGRARLRSHSPPGRGDKDPGWIEPPTRCFVAPSEAQLSPCEPSLARAVDRSPGWAATDHRGLG